MLISLVGTGSLDGEVTGACTSNVVKVKIVDACVLPSRPFPSYSQPASLSCPATHPANFCKIPEFGGVSSARS